MTELHLGIDNGYSGYWVITDNNARIINTFEFPTKTKKERCFVTEKDKKTKKQKQVFKEITARTFDIQGFCQKVKPYAHLIKLATIEKPIYISTAVNASANKATYHCFGINEAILQVLGIKYKTANPRASDNDYWRKEFNFETKDSKKIDEMLNKWIIESKLTESDKDFKKKVKTKKIAITRDLIKNQMIDIALTRIDNLRDFYIPIGKKEINDGLVEAALLSLLRQGD